MRRSHVSAATGLLCLPPLFRPLANALCACLPHVNSCTLLLTCAARTHTYTHTDIIQFRVAAEGGATAWAGLPLPSLPLAYDIAY